MNGKGKTMNDYISRQAAIDQWVWGCTDKWGKDSKVVHIEDIEALPSADVVEVVRCKDCRFYKNCLIVESAQCGEMFYCGRAERSEQ